VVNVAAWVAFTNPVFKAGMVVEWALESMYAFPLGPYRSFAFGPYTHAGSYLGLLSTYGPLYTTLPPRRITVQRRHLLSTIFRRQTSFASALIGDINLNMRWVTH
jgi:hypothetical protein